MSNILNTRPVTVSFVSDSGISLDAYKAALKRVEYLESKYANNPASVSDMSEAMVVLTGSTQYRVYAFELTLDISEGEYEFSFVEEAPNNESLAINNPEPETEPETDP